MIIVLDHETAAQHIYKYDNINNSGKLEHRYSPITFDAMMDLST